MRTRAVYEIMWKNVVERGMQQMAIRRMRIACCIPKATRTHARTRTHTEYVIPIALLLQQWLKDRASMLRHKYIACIVTTQLVV